MKPLDFILKIHEAGGSVKIADNKVRVEAPKAVLTREVQTSIKEQKDELLQWDVYTGQVFCMSGVMHTWLWYRDPKRPDVLESKVIREDEWQ